MTPEIQQDDVEVVMRDFNRTKPFLTFFFLQFLSYGVFCINARAIAFGWIRTMILSDMALAWIGFTVMKKIGEAKGNSEKWGYVIGGAIGSVVAVEATKWLFGR